MPDRTILWLLGTCLLIMGGCLEEPQSSLIAPLAKEDLSSWEDCLPMDSPHFSDLMSFLGQITQPYFGSEVCHWPAYPVPVRLFPAQNGDLDLAACLREAMDRWNEGEDTPWFTLDPQAEWGIRLVHWPDLELHPPTWSQITRLDEQGRPLRIHINLGNNYDSLSQRPYVIRALVHELAHGLFLWGHSPDPGHILWAGGPPLVAAPSPDERKAAHLWRDLPEGFDLGPYISGPLSTTASWPPGGRP